MSADEDVALRLIRDNLADTEAYRSDCVTRYGLTEEKADARAWAFLAALLKPHLEDS